MVNYKVRDAFVPRLRPLLAILIAVLFLAGTLQALQLSAQEAQSATILVYEDGSAQLVLTMEEPDLNATGFVTVVVTNTSIIVNYTMTLQLTGYLGGELRSADSESYVDIRGTDDGFEGKAEAKISYAGSNATLRMDPIRYRVDEQGAETYVHLYMEATGEFGAIIDLLYQHLTTAENMSNGTLQANIIEYKPGEKLDAEITSRGAGVPNVGLTIVSNLTQIERSGFRIERLHVYVSIRNMTLESWGYIRITGDVASMVQGKDAAEALQNIHATIKGVIPDDISKGLGEVSDAPEQLSSAALVLPTYYGFEARDGQVKIVLPRVTSTTGDTVQLLEQIARDAGAQSVETQQAEPSEPILPVSDEARGELSGSAAGPGLVLAAIVAVVLAAAALLVWKARS